jgi:hypothetical protein
MIRPKPLTLSQMKEIYGGNDDEEDYDDEEIVESITNRR